MLKAKKNDVKRNMFFTGANLYHVVVIALILALYYHTFVWLIDTWNNQPMYSHGFFIPAISGFLVYINRKEISSCETVSRNKLGLFVVVTALSIKVIGEALDINTLRAYSFIMLLAGLTQYLYGTRVLKKTAFPILYLIFMVPVYNFMVKPLSVTLKLLVAKLSVKVCSLFGFPIFRDGVQIFLSEGSLEVADPCSGIRSLIALIALGVLYMYLARSKVLANIVMFLTIIPIAILTNALRVILLILVAEFYHINATSEGMIHETSGLMVFLLALVLFHLTAKIMGVSYSK